MNLDIISYYDLKKIDNKEAASDLKKALFLKGIG